MATAEEILMAEEAEDIIVIDSDLRTINIPSTIKLLGVESDKDVKRLQFRMPATYGEVDLSAFDIRINYLNAKQQGDVYPVEDKTISEGYISFSWLVGKFALQYKGSVKFIVCLRELDEELVVLREFNTTPASLSVLEGLETGEHIVQTHPDVLEELLKRCTPVTHSWNGTVLTMTSYSGTTSVDLQGPKGPPGTVDFVSITEPPDGTGAYAIVVEEAFTINDVTFPKYAKGMFTAGSGDASMYVIDRSGAMYTAYRNNGAWDRATIVGQSSMTAYQLVANEGYEGTEDEFATKLLSLLELEKYNGETEDVEGDGDTGSEDTGSDDIEFTVSDVTSTNVNSFTVPAGYTFSQLVANNEDFTDAAQYIYYKDNMLYTDSNLTEAVTGDSEITAGATYYYEGEADTGSDDTELITFYVDSTEYEVKKGSTWADITTYYPDDFTIDTEDSSVYWKGAQVLGELDVPVNAELTIINGTYYGVMSG